jgi:TonB family protein
MNLTLFESGRTPFWMNQGLLISAVVHIGVIGAVAVQTDRTKPDLSKPSEEHVTFLVPLDKIPNAPPPQQFAVQWAVEGKGGGNEGIEQRPIEEGPPVASVAGKGEDKGGQPQAGPPPEDWTLSADTVLTVLEVDSAVVRDPSSAAPAYPAAMLAKSIQGTVRAQYVVDTLGLVDTTTFKVLETTHEAFTVAVREALPNMRFRPAIVRSHKVRQLVEQPFTFRIQPPVAPPTVQASAKKPGT